MDNNNPLLDHDEAITWFQMVELIVPPASLGPVTFDDQAQLRNQADQRVWVKNIELFTVTTYANSQKTNSIPGFPVADVPKGVLLLTVNGVIKINKIPLVKLIRANDQTNAYQPWITEFNTLENVQWDECAVVFSSATSNNAPVVMGFGVTFIKANVVKNGAGQEVLKYL